MRPTPAITPGGDAPAGEQEMKRIGESVRVYAVRRDGA